MEPITHFLTGACMGRAGLNRKTALATFTLTLAAEAPDLDVLGRIRGSAFAFAHHRGFTHSFVGVPLDAMRGGRIRLSYLAFAGTEDEQSQSASAMGASLSLRLPRRTESHSSRFHEQLRSEAILAIFGEVVFVGHRLHIRAHHTWRSSCWVLYFRRCFPWSTGRSEPVEQLPRGRIAATLALIGVVLLWGFRDFEHRRAVNALEARTYNDADPVRVSAYPHWVNPFQWDGVVETSSFFALASVDSLGPEVDPEGRLDIRYKPQETAITLAAKKSYLGRVFLDWAKYPVTETEVLAPASRRIHRPLSGFALCPGSNRAQQGRPATRSWRCRQIGQEFECRWRRDWPGRQGSGHA